MAAEQEEEHVGEGGDGEGGWLGLVILGGLRGEVFCVGEVDDCFAGFLFWGCGGRVGGLVVGDVGGGGGGWVSRFEDAGHVFIHDARVVPVYERFQGVHVIEGVRFRSEGTPADLAAEGARHGIWVPLRVEFVISDYFRVRNWA